VTMYSPLRRADAAGLEISAHPSRRIFALLAIALLPHGQLLGTFSRKTAPVADCRSAGEHLRASLASCRLSGAIGLLSCAGG